MAGFQVLKPEMDIPYFLNLNIDTILITSSSNADDIYNQIKFIRKGGIKVVKMLQD